MTFGHYCFNKVDKSAWFYFRSARATKSTVSVGDDGERERSDVLFMGNVRLDSRNNFFTVRTISKWNEIPDGVKNQRTINAFKTKYDEWKEALTKRQQQQT